METSKKPYRFEQYFFYSPAVPCNTHLAREDLLNMLAFLGTLIRALDPASKITVYDDSHFNCVYAVCVATEVLSPENFIARSFKIAGLVEKT